MMPGRSKETSMARLIARPAFMTFLVNAKRQTYAAQGDDATVTPLVPGSRQLEYQEGALLYRDIYFGGGYFVGQETVYERPYRGPNQWREGAYVYTDETQGDVERFWGVETITHEAQVVYQLRYSGGLLR
jgi:hypothetical protein